MVALRTRSVELHFIARRGEAPSSETLALRLPRNQDQGERDLNVRFIRAIAAGPVTAAALHRSVEAMQTVILEIGEVWKERASPLVASEAILADQIPAAMQVLKEAIPTYKDGIFPTS
jgi:hypothetical protein